MGNVSKPGTSSAAAAVVQSGTGTSEAREAERKIVREAQAGSKEAFEELVRRHQQRVFAVVGGILRRREDVEDVAQQVFLKAYVSIRRFDMRSAFSTWLYKVAVNECWDYLRKKKVRPLLYEADLSEEQVQKMGSYVASGNVPASPSERAQYREYAERLLDQLSDEDRQILVLKEVEGFPVEEIATIFDLNVNTVKVRLFRARARLVKFSREKMEISPDARRAGRKAKSDGAI
ncbi:MAG: RNA polymerase sigma factor [Candidatus Acidiferrales bacterium]